MQSVLLSGGEMWPLIDNFGVKWKKWIKGTQEEEMAAAGNWENKLQKL